MRRTWNILNSMIKYEDYIGYVNMKFDDFENHPLEKLIISLPIAEPILDVGCGNGNILNLFKGKDAMGIDPSKFAISLCEKGGINASLSTLEDFNTNQKFKTILCIGLICTIHDQNKFLIKMRDMLADGGKIYINFINKKSLKKKLGLKFAIDKGTDFFTINEFKELLERNGLKLVKAIGTGRIKIPSLSENILAIAEKK